MINEDGICTECEMPSDWADACSNCGVTEACEGCWSQNQGFPMHESAHTC